MTGSNTPTLILLHGATCNGRMWDALKRGLEPKFRVLTPDLPGHGARRAEPYTLQGAIDTAVQCAATVADSPIIVGGDSLGGYSSLAAAASLPEGQLKGLILCGSSSNLSGAALLPYRLQIAVFKTLLALRGEDKLIASMRPKLIRDIGMEPRDVDAMIGAGMSLKVFSQCVGALRDIDFRSKLAAVEVPVMIVNGTKDSGHMRQEATFLAVAKDASVEHLENCQHGVTIRRSADCALLFNRFAARLFA
jgi:pimeloyl-ACP methyl ester carboxylesterase